MASQQWCLKHPAINQRSMHAQAAGYFFFVLVSILFLRAWNVQRVIETGGAVHGG